MNIDELEEKLKEERKKNRELQEKNSTLRKRNKELLDELCYYKYVRAREMLKIEKGESIKQRKPVENKYQKFRKKIIERDGNKCTKCGATENLQVHHIKPRKTHPELVMDEDNCVTLCILCHIKTDTYLKKN